MLGKTNQASSKGKAGLRFEGDKNFTQYRCGFRPLFRILVPLSPRICRGQESEHFAYSKESPFVPLPERITAPLSASDRIALRFTSFRPLTVELTSGSVFGCSQLSRYSRIAWATRSASASLFSTPSDTFRDTSRIRGSFLVGQSRTSADFGGCGIAHSAS